MRLFDLHCDTAMSIYHSGKSIFDNDCHISLKKAEKYDKYVQLTAMFTDTRDTDDEGWENFLRCREYLEKQCEEYGIKIIRTKSGLRAFEKSDDKFAFIFTVEDARILNGKTERVREMYDAGVRVVTPVWGGNTCIGGAHNTGCALTEFGHEAVAEMCRCGILPDISHSSFMTADEIMDICEQTGVSPVATHMNSYSVCGHTRNLTDDRFMRLVRLGGIAGVSLCPPHLAEDSSHCTSADPARHIMYYDSLIRNHTALGCDYDGTDVPPDLSDVSFLPNIADRLRENGYTDDDIDAVFYRTAYGYMSENLPD